MRATPAVPGAPKTKEEEATQDAFWRRDSGESGCQSTSDDGDRPPPYAP